MTLEGPAKSGRATPSLRASLRGSAVIQLILLAIGGTAADGGVLGTWVIYALVTFWAVVLPMLVFRRSRLTKADLFFVRWGFLIILGIYLTSGSAIYEWAKQWR